MKVFYTTALLLTLFYTTYGQPAIPLENPSFEGAPRHSTVPGGWASCGGFDESPPDTQPSGDFGVTKAPFDGTTYLGMVVRDNNTWESVGQRLARPMMKGQCYQLKLYLCRSEKYVSLSRATNKLANYAVPAILRVWGGTRDCAKAQLLASSEPVEHFDWAYYELHLRPAADYPYLIIEAYYDPFQVSGPYNGNILVDKMSGLAPVDCQEASVQGRAVNNPGGDTAWGVDTDIELLHEELPSEDELLPFIAKHGKQAKFTVFGNDFYQQSFIDKASPDLQVFYCNMQLYLIGKALKAYPQYTILVSVGAESENAVKRRLKSAEAAFQAAGLPENQYGLKPQSRSDRKRTWLWKLDKYGYSIRIVEK